MRPVVRGGEWCRRALPRNRDEAGRIDWNSIARLSGVSTEIPAIDRSLVELGGGSSSASRPLYPAAFRAVSSALSASPVAPEPSVLLPWGSQRRTPARSALPVLAATPRPQGSWPPSYRQQARCRAPPGPPCNRGQACGRITPSRRGVNGEGAETQPSQDALTCREGSYLGDAERAGSCPSDIRAGTPGDIDWNIPHCQSQ